MYRARRRFNADASLGALARRIATNCATYCLRPVLSHNSADTVRAADFGCVL
jgi:hypothetical protein